MFSCSIAQCVAVSYYNCVTSQGAGRAAHAHAGGPIAKY